MKLLNYQSNSGFTAGIKMDEGILSVRELAETMGQHVPNTMEAITLGGLDTVRTIQSLLDQAKQKGCELKYIQESTLVYGPCIPQPGKIICVGLNYRDHAIECRVPFPEFPVLFSKFNNTITAHQQSIQLPKGSDQIDYEAELVIVMGRKAKNVQQHEALDYVLGYCNANDISARDLQGRTSQWLLGKSIDGFCPIGPYLVTADEVGDPNHLPIRLELNGELRQNQNTNNMIFSCKEIISYISQYITLNPGDIILTGTPEGVIVGYPPEKRVWLKTGDRVSVEIEKLGKLVNQFY